ncbi:MAG: hypothetical protein ACT4RN_09460 [Pseudonocardia sp.]
MTNQPLRTQVEVSTPPGTADLQTAEADAGDVRGLRWDITDDERTEISATVLAALKEINKLRS